MIKRISLILLSLVLLLLASSCSKSKFANVLFDDYEYSVDDLENWSAKIKYIRETRGTTDEIYTKIYYNSDNPFELFTLIEMFYGAAITEAPTEFIYSAEGMSDYIFEFYKEGTEEPVLSFYYDESDNLLTRVVKRLGKKDGKTYIDYQFYSPNGDLSTITKTYREKAREPNKENNVISLNQKQLIASVLPEELEERMQYNEDEYEQQEGIKEGEIACEIYSGELPDDQGTVSKLYDSEDIPSLSEDEVVIMARMAGETGEPEDLIISFLEFNSYYTIVSISYPNLELQEEMNIKTPNAILVNIDDIDPAKHIIFVDENNTVVSVVVPFVN